MSQHSSDDSQEMSLSELSVASISSNIELSAIGNVLHIFSRTVSEGSNKECTFQVKNSSPKIDAYAATTQSSPASRTESGKGLVFSRISLGTITHLLKTSRELQISFESVMSPTFAIPISLLSYGSSNSGTIWEYNNDEKISYILYVYIYMNMYTSK